MKANLIRVRDLTALLNFTTPDGASSHATTAPLDLLFYVFAAVVLFLYGARAAALHLQPVAGVPGKMNPEDAGVATGLDREHDLPLS